MTGNAQSNGSSSLEIAQSNQDLIITKGRRKKRTWIIAGVVCAIVVALVVAAIVLLTNAEENKSPGVEEPTLSLEDLLHGRVNPSSFNGTWVSDNEVLYTDAAGNLVLYSLEGKKTKRDTKTIILGANESIFRAGNFELSPDRKYLKVAHSFQKVYRHSYRANYTLIDLSTKVRTELRVGDRQDLLLAVWGPKGNSLAFIFENNIYYKESVTGEEIIPITQDTGFVNNGIPDWVYEEEVFSSNKALWFSPDGNKLAYGRFDDKDVQLMVLPIYGEPGSLLFQYPRAQVVKYPKAGTPNPTVTLHVVDLNNVTDNRQVDPPSDLRSSQPILSAVSWATKDTLIAIWMNRVQNAASIVSYTLTPTSTPVQIVSDLREPAGWLELFTAPLFSHDGSKLVLILPHDQGGDLGAYRHLVMLSLEEHSRREPLTKGAFVVTEILGWNHDRNEIFYLANTENDSAVQHLYSVSVASKAIKCLSCGVKSKNRHVDCLYNVAEFSKDASNYVLTCAGPDIPDIAIYSLDAKLAEWDDNSGLRQLVSGKRLPEMKRLSFEVGGGFKAHVSLKLPPNLDTSGNTKYPMLVNVYAGPDSFQVVERFNIDWGSYLAANKSIIYATIDGRSSGLKGNKILFASYRNLGTVEIVDQINVTKQIQATLPYVDHTRTAIWGWSYGGYASGMVLADDKEGVFKCGMSVAPVTDWTLYDSIYTERFMGLPTPNDNAEGYRNASLLLKYEGLRDKQYFLIHGTFDDNVHYQQSMLWAKVLEQNDILFRQLSYPDEDHSLGSVRPHLYHSLEDFLDECFIEKGN